MTRRVAIIGAAHRFPGTTPETFWQDLQDERDLVTRVADDRWSQEAYQHPDKRHPGTSVTFAAGSLGDISGFDAGFFGISPREATNMDPQQRMLLELAWEAIEHAGIKPSALRGSQCGVFLGIASLDYSYRIADDMAAIDASTATGNTSSIASNRLSYVFDLHGPSMSLDTACSSSLVAFHQACQSIRAGETDMALAGGISLHLHPYGFIIFSKASMLSPNGRCRVFDAAGDGYVRSEGAGLFLLKDHDRAVADGDRILAVVAGSAVNTDGHKSGLTVPSPKAQSALMRDTYARAGIAADEIDYLEAHGTGTAVGDPIETRAIGEALGRKRREPLLIGSVKSNVGHLETASGVAGLVKALYSLKHREVPATIGIDTPNPNIKFDEWNLRVVTQRQPLKAEGRLIIGVNSFGFGGANAHVILESPPQSVAFVSGSRADSEPGAESTTAGTMTVPLLLSAKGEPALKAMAGRLAEWLDEQDANLYDIAYTLYQHRERHPDAALVFAESHEQAAQLLAAYADTEASQLPAQTAKQLVRGEHLEQSRGPAFIYTGNGCQWETMGRDLLESSATFAAAVEEVDALFQRHSDFSLRAELMGDNGKGDDGESRLARTEIAQPALFAVQVGITTLLREQGIEPDAVAGHSVGEVAAAWACGALSLADAVKVIYQRSYYQGLTRGQGQMTAVAMGEQDIRELLATPDFPGIYLAGINSSKGVTLAGDPESLRHLETQLRRQGVFAKRLPLDYAFHSPAMDPIENDLMASLAAIRPAESKLRYVSTVTGSALDGSSLDARYWWQNIREPVRFEAAIGQLVDDGIRTFVEIGSHPILRRYLSDSLRDHELEGIIIDTLDKKRSGEQCLRDATAKLLMSGAIDAGAYHFPVAGQLIDLPRYPWQHERFWIKDTAQSQQLLERHYQHPLLGYRLAQQEHTWESQLDTGRLPWLADHVVGEGAVFPGAGFVELALAASRHQRDAELIDIEELEIKAPLLLDGANGRLMRMQFSPHDGHLEIRSREPLSEGEWQPNAIARLMQQSRGFLLNREAPARPLREPDFTLDQHLAMARHIGLNYGPAFQAIARGWVEGDSVIGEIELPAVIEADLDATYLHPGILDSAFQMFIPLLARDGLADAGLAFVPVRVGRLQLQLGDGRPVLAHARMLKRAPHSFTADFELFDAQGRAVAVLSETRFKAIRLKRQHQQRLSYLDVRLTPAPRQPARPDLAPLYAGVPRLIDAFAEHTGHRYANEVDPLLDSLAEAFAERALRQLNSGQSLSQAHYLELIRAQPQTQPLLDQLLHLLGDAGRLQADDQGWRFVDDGQDSIAPESIWQLLVRDYPDHFAPVQRLGRFGLHLPALLDGREDATSLALDDASLARLTPRLIGEGGWLALADMLRKALPATLECLPAGQRLRLLEAGPAAPALGERLCDLLDADRCAYRVLATDDTSRHQAEQLAERFPLIDIESLDALDASANPSHQAQLALISLEVGHQERVEGLLDALPRHLAANADILLIGVRPSVWLDTLLATPGLGHDGQPLRACEPEAVIAQLERLGAESPQLIPLEDDDSRGSYLIHARLPGVIDSPAPPANQVGFYLLVDDSSAALGERLAEALRQQGEHVSLVDNQESLGEVLGGQISRSVVDLRRGEQRCEQAARWVLELDPGAPSTAVPGAQTETIRLWLITRGVAAMWQPADAGLQTPASLAGSDAALWGFGRSLANEASGFSVTLLDLPGEEDLHSDTQSKSVLDALVTELTAPDAENEIVLDADGRRFATRLRLVSPPGPVEPVESQRQAMTLGFPLPGQLRSLRWAARPLPTPGEGQVEIRVKATGLNFRDVMYTLGLLSDEAIENGFAGPTLGLEFSGIVEAVGPGVTGVAPGAAVVGFGPASFSDRLIADQNAIALLPEGVGFAAAATISTTFFTVYYALKHLARLAPGEKLLIHGAAGGVGIAAIQVAQWLGAEIYATVGSEEKRDFLRLLGVNRLYNSRALTFAEEILEDTDGHGVDVVLNSLAGEAINQNLRVLRPFGRFLELGKRDFYENTPIGLRPFRNNLSYFGIDSDQLMKELPALTAELFGEMMARFRDGTFTPLPYTAFSNIQVVEAFRYMQQARQIGKVVVTHERSPLPEQSATLPNQPLVLPADASYLVTGGLGGFGLKTAQWLADHGARHLILIGRSGATSEEARAGVAGLEARGVNVHAAACDVTDRDALAALIEPCGQRWPALRGVVHAATVIDDGLIRNLDGERIRRVLEPKIEGARHLDALTANCPLDFFVLYSSATTLFGNPGQANYVAANHWLEALAANRRARGLPASCLRWGAIDDVGFLARNTRTRDALQERLGGSALRSDDALAVLERLLVDHDDSLAGPSLGVLELDWSALARFLPTAQAPRFDEIAREADEDERQEDGGEGLADLFASLTPEQLHAAVTDLLRSELSSILLIEEDKIDAQRSVYDMGFDSLMGVELMTAIESRLGVQIPIMVLGEASTLDKLAGVLIAKLHQQDDDEDDDASTADAEMASLAARHGAEDYGPKEHAAKSDTTEAHDDLDKQHPASASGENAR